MRIWLFCYGFYWISVTHSQRKRKRNRNSRVSSNGRTPDSTNGSGHAPKRISNVASNSNLNINDNNDIEKGNANDNPYLRSHCIVANHHTAFDGFVLYYLYGSSAVMKAAIQHFIFTGTIAKAAQNIFVDRISRKGRKKAIKDIEYHMCNYDLPPLLLFPQATCSNISTLTTFKVGAFIPGLPVTPIALNYHSNKYSNLSFVGNSAFWEMFYSMCQFINYVSIHECNDYFPNSKEKEDARLFAENVRQKILIKLENEGAIITATQHSLDDFLLIRKLGKHRSKQSLLNGAEKRMLATDWHFSNQQPSKAQEWFNYLTKHFIKTVKINI